MNAPKLGGMERINATGYKELCERFQWQIPDRFNFAVDVVDRWARDPVRVALIAQEAGGRERRFTYRDISSLTKRLAAALRHAGVHRGDRVVILLPRIAEWQLAMVACLRMGAVPIPCVEMLTQKDIAYRVAHSGAKAAITTAANVPKFAGLPGLDVRITVGDAPGWLEFWAQIDSQQEGFQGEEISAEEPAILFYTSGSTGNPKGVTHVARALFAWRVSAWYWLGLTEADTMWCTADTGWSKAGTSILFGPWSSGSAVFFYNGPFDAKERLRLIRDYGVTVFCAAATEFRHIVALDLADRAASRLRMAVSAGEAVNPDVIQRWTAATGVPLLEAYGQTETLMTVLNYTFEPVRAGSMGKASPGTELTVLSDKHERLPAGERGQLALRLPNPQLMSGYWNDPERTREARTVADGIEWFLTGDLASIDEDGYVRYEGRVDDLINSAGYRIGPTEVENALIEHPAVLESAVVGAPDEERGEIVKAFVVLRPGFAGSETLAKALQEHVKQVTAPYKYPRRIEFVQDLPKTPSGKLLRRMLRDQEYQRAPRSRSAGASQ
jgi:acyl-coenzyme A synthetase/AMP-(fatty) acid ligase